MFFCWQSEFFCGVSLDSVSEESQCRVTRLCPHSLAEGNDTHDHWLWKTGYRVRRNRKCCTPPLQNISLTRMTAGWCPHSVTPVAVFKFRNRLRSLFLLSLSNSVERKKFLSKKEKEQKILQAGCIILYIANNNSLWLILYSKKHWTIQDSIKFIHSRLL